MTGALMQLAAVAASAYSGVVLSDGPVIYLSAQETTGTSAADSSGNSLTSTYAGTVVLNDMTDPAAPTALGKHVRLDGTSGHLALPAGSWFAPATAGWSFEGWLYIRSWSNWARILDTANAANTADTYYCASGAVTSNMRISTSGGISDNICARISTGQWKHVAVTQTAGGTAISYVNAVQTGTYAGAVSANISRSLSYIGRSVYPSDPYLAASLAHVAYYNTVLTPTRLAAHYTAGIA